MLLFFFCIAHIFSLTTFVFVNTFELKLRYRNQKASPFPLEQKENKTMPSKPTLIITYKKLKKRNKLQVL